MKPIIAITAKTEELRNRQQTTVPNTYARVIEDAGGIPLIIPITDNKENISQIARYADGFLFSGGDDIHPRYYSENPIAEMVISPNERTEFEIALLKEIIQTRKPVLGICLGAQLINITLGGSLYQDIPTQIENHLNHREQHNITIAAGTMLDEIFAPENTHTHPSPLSKGEAISIFSTHHQSIKSPGKGLIVSALSSDGVIEAIELQDFPFLIGVQWHPEREPASDYTRLLTYAFVKAAS